MKRLGKVETAVMRQAWKDNGGRRTLDRSAAAVALWGWEDLGSRYTIKRFDAEVIGERELKSGQDRLYQAVRSLRKAGYLEETDDGDILTGPGKRVASSLFRPRVRKPKA